LPRGDFLTTLAWVGVFGGPLLLLVAAVAWHGMPAELILAGVAAFIGGFVLLVARMPSEHPDDPDDGAVV
jgi:Flp pilus assembly protein TadB